MTHHVQTPAPAIDPVCGRAVDTRQALITTTSGDDIQYFCSDDCRRRYTAPAQRAAATAQKKKGFWARYLERLNKTTGGKTPPCCS